MKKFVNIEEQLASSTDTIVLNTKKNGSEILSYYLRAYRGRLDLASIVGQSKKRPDFLSILEQIRTELKKGNFKKAETLIVKTTPNNELEKIELFLELTRLLIHKGKYEEAVRISDNVVNLTTTPPVSRMTLYQTRGHAYIALGDFNKAIKELESAITLSEVFPNASSGFSARTFLVKAYTELEKEDEAKQSCDILNKLLLDFKQNEIWLDRLLSVLRAEYTYYRKFGCPIDAIIRLKEAEQISIWLEEKDTAKRCMEDMKQCFNELSPEQEKQHKINNAILCFSGWQYFPRLNLILTISPKKIETLNDSPITKKILLELAERPLSNDDFFKKIWNIDYKIQQHAGHIRSTLSKIRKKLPKESLTVSDGIIYLK
ncbi:MAG: hypothetical protein KAQ98_03295 [Bacteriovoracaceae bacterium]|nr:hypothetical protein [Bacteriovoracaceae bacterium]